MLPLTKLHAEEEGFLVNGELMIVAEVDALEVIDQLDGSEESSPGNESMKVNGFQVLPSQVESVRLIFERHPDIASEFRAKNQYLRKACMNFLLSIVETLCQPLQELSNEDLVEADIALTYLKDARFNVDWLEKKLDQVRDKKEKELTCLAKLQETGETLLILKQKCTDLDALMETEMAELSATRTPLSFDDVV
ncbi:PREDICTED: MATH domain and coiled-coil domain-containing protein At3g58410-like isoform X2 [Camelina sativa]|uniref:MATH domain and coiled-coil domain-containing protein At3g58410-like isoform X2 n=1 Tax=Camelina sativa TaxID=90675 RepID=A0ABM1RLI8_CAMSA|nr:PREDICTED: MATH domain and coiled-coil domain-containing protein At3g58410-like isoform X2 [Camelina sativa]